MKAPAALSSRLPHLLALALLGVLPLTAQTLPICGGHNHATDWSDGNYTLPAQPAAGTFFAGTNEIAIYYSPTRTVQIQRVEIFFGLVPIGGPPANLPSGRVQIREMNTATGEPGNVISGTGTACASPLVATNPTTPPGATIGWRGGTFCAPITLTANTPYWITFYDGWGLAQNLATETLGQTTPYVTAFGGTFQMLAPWSALQNDQAFKIRLHGPTCSQGAAIDTIGFGCGGASIPRLSVVGLPELGSNTFALSLSGMPAGLPTGLYWSTGYSFTGTGVAPGCSLYLDTAGLLALAAVGANPLMTGQTGVVNLAWGLPIPADPALSGVSLAFQAVVIDPAGVPTATPGVSFALSNAAVAVIGE